MFTFEMSNTGKSNKAKLVLWIWAMKYKCKLTILSQNKTPIRAMMDQQTTGVKPRTSGWKLGMLTARPYGTLPLLANVPEATPYPLLTDSSSMAWSWHTSESPGAICNGFVRRNFLFQKKKNRMSVVTHMVHKWLNPISRIGIGPHLPNTPLRKGTSYTQ